MITADLSLRDNSPGMHRCREREYRIWKVLHIVNCAILVTEKSKNDKEGLIMREFKCRSIGNDCSWKHIAKTEELLADIVAVHLRDVHGRQSLDNDMVVKIKNAFSNPAPLESKAAEDLIMKVYRCGLGKGCEWKYIAQTEELIVDGVAVHAREAHGIREFSAEMKVKVEKALQPWKG
jgi:predicted small metal-binding protein